MKVGDSSKEGGRIDKADLDEIATGSECVKHRYGELWHVLIGRNSSLKLHSPKRHVEAESGSVIFASQGNRATQIRITVGALDIYTCSGRFLIVKGGSDVPERALLLNGRAAVKVWGNASTSCRLQRGQLAEVVYSSGTQSNNTLRITNLADAAQSALLDSSVGPGWDRWIGEFKS